MKRGFRRTAPLVTATPVVTAIVASVAISASGSATAQPGDRDCSDFRTQGEARRFYEANGPGDPHRLDRDKDGIACESLPSG